MTVVKDSVGLARSWSAKVAIRPRIPRNAERLLRNGVAKANPANHLSGKVSTSDRQGGDGQQRLVRRREVSNGALNRSTQDSAEHRLSTLSSMSRGATAKSKVVPRPAAKKAPSCSRKQIAHHGLVESKSPEVVLQGGMLYRMSRVSKTLQHYMDCDYRRDVLR